MWRSSTFWFGALVAALVGMSWSLTISTGDHFWAWPPFAALFVFSLYRLAALTLR